jgi:hypothetical protein
VWAWTDPTNTFISRFCEACLESGTPCISRSRAITALSEETSFSCRSCSSASSRCNWLIAYQSHPLEDTDIVSIPDYRARVLARQNRAAIGTPLEIAKYAVVVLDEPEIPVRVKPQAQQPHIVTNRPKPTYSRARSAYENLISIGFDDPLNWDAMPNYWESSWPGNRQHNQSMNKVISAKEFDVDDMISRGRARQENIRASVVKGQRHFSWTHPKRTSSLLTHGCGSSVFLYGHPKSRRQPFAHNNARTYRSQRPGNGTRTPTLTVTFTEVPFQGKCPDPTQATVYDGYRHKPEIGKDNVDVPRELWRLSYFRG